MAAPDGFSDGSDEGSFVNPLEAALASLPHRPPFKFLDRLLVLEPQQRAVGMKLIRADDPYLAGHFPGLPVMPGVLIVEALAQLAVCLEGKGRDEGGGLPLLVGIDNCRFRRPVGPGDEVRLEVVAKRRRGQFGRVLGTAWLGDTRVAEAEILFTWWDGAPASGTLGRA
ncbi:MAG: 3-hydroxyacyl-ACP dehydratase FabZ [Candidatus Sericytochromatia bacterium]|nr:3-hydroxyacyl-ACP dehydratase FabZ [Candidatus Sericytochromatia bacterium]